MRVESERTTEAPDPQAIEAALSVLPGVARADVELAHEGRPGVLRLVLAPGGDELSVAQAARRILRLQFGVDLDPGRLEIVEDDTSLAPPSSVLRLVETDWHGAVLNGEDIDGLLASLDPGPGPRFDTDVLASAARHPAGVAASPDGHSRVPDQPASEAGPEVPPGRLVMSGLSVTSDGLGVTATVSLTYGGRERSRSVEAAPSAAALQRAVATATLRALDELLPAHIRIEIDAVSMILLGDGTVAVVRVIWVTAEGAEHLTGSSEVRDDPREAVIRATLDAVNRRLHVELVD